MRSPKIGRPKVLIDWEEFDKLCGIQCTKIEICDWFRCSESTIERACKKEKKKPFDVYYESKKGFGKISLRRKQWQVAMQGDRTMLIWLGKQYLAQTDQVSEKFFFLNDETKKKEREASVSQFKSMLEESKTTTIPLLVPTGLLPVH